MIRQLALRPLMNYNTLRYTGARYSHDFRVMRIALDTGECRAPASGMQDLDKGYRAVRRYTKSRERPVRLVAHCRHPSMRLSRRLRRLEAKLVPPEDPEARRLAALLQEPHSLTGNSRFSQPSKYFNDY
jgi:hypothetical protein